MSKLNSPEIKAQVTPLQRNIFGVFAVSLAGGSAYCAELAHSAYLRLESLAEPATTFGPSPEAIVLMDSVQEYSAISVVSALVAGIATLFTLDMNKDIQT